MSTTGRSNIARRRVPHEHGIKEILQGGGRQRSHVSIMTGEPRVEEEHM
jgi:hypothetical protein